jgi:hypothetical protein
MEIQVIFCFFVLLNNPKSIKKLYKILLLFVLAVLTLPTVGYFALHQKKVQDYLIGRLTTKITAYLGAPVTIEGVSIDVFSNVTLSNVCVRTPQNDTILYTPTLTLQVNSFTLATRYLEFEKVTLNKPRIRFYVDSTNTINFQFIIDKLQSSDTTVSKHSMAILIRNINIVDADFTLKGFYDVKRPYGINFTDVHLRPLNVIVSNFRVNHGITMDVTSMSFRDKSGFVIDKLSTTFRMDKENMVYNKLNILTPYSDITARQVLFHFRTSKDFKAIIFGKYVPMTIDLRTSDVSSKDIAYFLPIAKDFHVKARVSGTFHGLLTNLKARNLDIVYANHTHLKCDVDITGLPDITKAFLYVDVKSLSTTPSDIQSIPLPYSLPNHIVLPEFFSRLSLITYRGKFTGFGNDFVAYGTLNSNLGKIETDISLHPDTAGYYSLKGQIKSVGFDLGALLNKSNILGKISLDAMSEVYLGAGKEPKAKITGVASSFVLNGYNYTNVQLDGMLSNGTYDGSLSVSDPNIDFDFLGKVNLSKQIPEFNFIANIKSANLFKLNFDKSDSSSYLSCYATAEFEGNNIDNLKGEIKLWNAVLRKTGKEFRVSNLLVYNENVNHINSVILRSDFADGEISGQYRFTDVVNSFRTFTRNYLPSLLQAPQGIIDSTGNNNFRFHVSFKDTKQLTDYLVPGLYISKDSKLTGNYNPSNKDFSFMFSIPLAQHKNKKWYDLCIDGRTENGLFSLSAGCSNLRINNHLDLQNFTVLTDFKNDSIDMHVRWNNWDTMAYKGNFTILGSLKTSENGSRPILKFEVKPSQVILKDTIWSIKSGLVVIDSSDIRIDHFLIAHSNQLLTIHGGISQNPETALAVEFNNVNLGNLSTVLAMNKLHLGGFINGKAELFNLYKNPIFVANVAVDSLWVNQVSIGQTTLNAVFNNSEKNIKIEAFSERGIFKTLNIKGLYSIAEQKLDFNIDLNKLKVDVFEPYLINIFNDVRGVASGKLRLTGNIDSPQLDGLVKIQKGSFTVNYLKTRYTFTDSVRVRKNAFLLNDVEVYDNYGTKCMVNGYIDYRKLRDLYVNIGIDVKEPFECLNTTEKDNNMYYGHGFLTGKALIHGTPQGDTVDIKNAVTAVKSEMVIPITTRVDMSETDFVHARNKPTTGDQSTNKYEIDKINETQKVKSAISNFVFNMNLTVTPDADLQLVFDQKIGDIIRGNGSGNLTIKLDGGNFRMDGKYTINEGKYLFTAQNVLSNMYFILENGGTITWDGSPIDAIVNIGATYKVKASLNQLNGAAEGYNKRVPIDCQLFLTDKLMNPTVTYNIKPSNSDQETSDLIKKYIYNEEELTRQFLSLLIVKSFMPDPNSTTGNSGGDMALSAARSNGFEVLSNQLSRMVSQGVKDIDIGINYRPSDGYTTGQAELALSKQLLNDRVSISGNFDVGGNTTSVTKSSNNSAVVGEGAMELKLNNKGNLRLKAFNRSNQGSLIEQSPYTQGVGVMYKEDFNSFGELLKHYYSKLFARKEKKIQPVDDKNGATENR